MATMPSGLEVGKDETVQERGKYGSPGCTQEQQQETLLYQILSKPGKPGQAVRFLLV